VATLGLASRTWQRAPDWRSDIALFSRDTESDPRFREGYYVLATALTQAGRHDEAAEALLRLDEVGQDFEGYSSFLRSQDAFLLLCRVHLEREDQEAAIGLFDGQLSADSPELAKAPQIFLCGALALEQAGRPREAMPILRAIHDLWPSGAPPELIVTIARCSAAAGLNHEARSWLTRLPAGSESNPSVAIEVERVQAILRSH
jgi:thioredoxin-like negative regulator of GroEL